jgi:nitrogen fixation/metabolism regulation signal transduction histidine kinase
MFFDSFTTMKSLGPGPGLTVFHTIIEAHGGRIDGAIHSGRAEQLFASRRRW